LIDNNKLETFFKWLKLNVKSKLYEDVEKWEMDILGYNTPIIKYPCPFNRSDEHFMCRTGDVCKSKCMFMAY